MVRWALLYLIFPTNSLARGGSGAGLGMQSGGQIVHLTVGQIIIGGVIVIIGVFIICKLFGKVRW